MRSDVGNIEFAGKRESVFSDTVMVCSLSLVVLLFFSPLLVGDQTLFFRDILVFSYPMKYFLYRAYHEKFLPFWDPQLFGGTPFLASLQTCVFYPPSLLFFLDDFNRAFNLFFIFHLLLLALSVYALTRHWGLSNWAGAGSALTTLFGGYFLSLSSTMNHFQSAAWLPLVFLFCQKYLIAGGARNWLAGIFCWACQILGGGPEVCIMTAVLLYSHSLVLVPRDGGIRGMFRQISTLSLMAAMAIALTAVQLLPTWQFINESVRSGGLDFGAHSTWSLSPKALGNLFLPELFIGFMDRLEPPSIAFIQSCYMGLAGMISLLLAKGKAARYWVFVFIAGIFFSLGRHNPFYAWIYGWVPGLGLFRFPEKYFFVSAFSLVFLVGYACKNLFEGERNPRRLAIAILCLVLIMAGLALAFPERRMPFVSGLFWLSALYLSCHYYGHAGNLAKYLFVMLIFIDLAPKNRHLVPMIDKSFYAEPLTARAEPAQGARIYSGSLLDDPDKNMFPLQPTLLLRHMAAKERLHPNLGTIYGFSYADGLLGIESKDAWLWSEVFKRSPPEKRLRILQRSNVGYVIAGNELAISGTMQALSNVLPRAFLAANWRLAEGGKSLNTYYDESFDPRREVLLSEPVTLGETADFAGTVENAVYEANRIVIKSHQNGDGFLVLLDTWFPGWTAKVDGRPEPIYRANHFYRAVKMGPGSHTVEFSYEAPGYRAGLFISGATILLATLIAGFRKQAVK